MQIGESEMQPGSAGLVKSAARALDLLDDVTFNGPGTQKELAQRLGIPASSMNGLLRTLVARGWLVTDPTGVRYQLGTRPLSLGASYLAADSSLGATASVMDEVVKTTGGAVHLGRLAGSDVVYLVKREKFAFPMFSAVGRHLPAYATSLGRAILADRSITVREELVPPTLTKLTPHTVTNRDTVLAMINGASRLGYAVESEEACLGVRCFGVALGPSSGPFDAISVAVPVDRLDARREKQVIRALLHAKSRLSA